VEMEMEENDAVAGAPPLPEKKPPKHFNDSDDSDSEDEEVVDTNASSQRNVEPKSSAVVEDVHQEIKFGVTWKTISKTLDKFFFVAFSIGSLAVSGVFLVPMVMTIM